MSTALTTCTAPVTTQSAIELIRRDGGTDTFLDIKEKERQEVLNKLHAMLLMEEKVDNGLKIEEAKIQVANFFKGAKGLSVSGVGKLFAMWRKGGQKPDVNGKRSGVCFAPRDWRMFLSNYNNGNPDAVLKNEDFKKFVLQRFGETSRWDASGNALHERLLDMWFKGEEIPGFGNIRKWCAARGRPVPVSNIRRVADIPEGWSPRHLSRLLPTSTAKRVYIQRGEHAAHDHWGDQLLRDRSKLMPFQLVTFDDVRFDIQVLMPVNGGVQTVYPQAIFALDVATGVILAKGVMGAYTREYDSDGGLAGTKRGFQQADMRWLVTAMLEKYGIPKNWQMKLLLENASASLSETDKKVFQQLTGIEIESTGLVRNKLFKSGFVEQGGMPWQKGWIEACFRLLHCRINHLPGTVGSRYDLTRGSVAQEVKYNLKIAEEACAKGIPLSELRFSILTLEDFHTLLDEYVLRLNFRTTHNLQGFKKVAEYEYATGEWIRADHPQAADIIPVGSFCPTRMEAPLERAVRLMQGHEMIPVHPRQLTTLALDKREITVRGEKVTLTAKSISTDKLIFRDLENAEMLEKFNGKEKALIGFVSHDASCIHLFTNDRDMQYIGSPKNQQRIDISDETAILCEAGKVDRARNRIRDEVAAEIFEPRNTEIQQIRDHNEQVLQRETVSTEIVQATNHLVQKQRQEKQIQKADFDSEELLEQSEVYEDDRYDDFNDDADEFGSADFL